MHIIVKSLNLVSPDAKTAFFGETTRCTDLHRVASLGELRRTLEALTQGSPASCPVTLDLIGHSTSGHNLLRLGGTPINMLDPAVNRFFRNLADSGVLARLDVVAVRLLGCDTAVTESGQLTIRMLSRTLGLPVYGTLAALGRSHTTAEGFNPTFSHLLVEASALV
jgi:hypothetical protein